MSNADCYRIRHNALLGGTTIDWSKVKTRRCSGIGAPRQINILVQHGQPNITIACITASTNPQLRQPKIGATSSYIWCQTSADRLFASLLRFFGSANTNNGRL
ncbi:hypothetical protein VFPPC_18728 [Pochonia chlamydosporia 170]|uniref:Uncharacterized protein n=1 Tax=Pochonia chlamydosporia 170 TaxID=1380566 RepID=A0A219ATP5_METCM|nr:hypothetical protein VFPPC_18728 [Pochonia chlamydosporia 170]OWT43545.1 hypothetical protein VFPPC_18728 [Pochonia chlamydosporia 170]